MKIISLVLCCAVSCFSNQILAQSIDIQTIPEGIRAQYIQCIKDNQHVEKNIKQCITDELAYQNRQLDEKYSQLAVILNKGQKTKLAIAQQAWLDQENKDQNFEASIYQNAENELAQAHLYRVYQRVKLLRTATVMACCYLVNETVQDYRAPYASRPAPKGIRKEFFQCLKENVGDFDKATCLSDERTYQHDRLNQQYKKLLLTLDPMQKQKLIIAQRAWLNQKNKNYNFQLVIYEERLVYYNIIDDAEIYGLADRANWLTDIIYFVKNNGAQK